jgi:putative glycerol-1-phosphate prenyltransferase
MSKIYQHILASARRKKARLAVLIDPDKFNPELITLCNECAVSYFFVGGSRLQGNTVDRIVSAIKKLSKIPVVIFPGDEKQLSAKADALLFLSLISGRNAEYLIGKHVEAAPYIRKHKIECISTGYVLIDGARESVTQQVTGTKPLQNAEMICATALAGEYLGMKMIYLEAGSGAKTNVASKIISRVKKTISIPLLVGGGIDSSAKAGAAIKAGADVIVVGNALENDIQLVKKLSPLFKVR